MAAESGQPLPAVPYRREAVKKCQQPVAYFTLAARKERYRAATVRESVLAPIVSWILTLS